jgi:hypothetical protein
MSPIPFFKTHPRSHFSAFLDGELTAARAARLQAHLAGCPACAAELDGLRAVRAAVRDLPEAPAPRSFALTPEMDRDASPARALPARRPLQPLVTGLRLTSAGLATALAVVVVVAVAGGGGNGGGGNDLAARMESTNAEYATAPTQSLIQNDSAATSAPVPTEQLFTPFPSVGGTPRATADAGSGVGGAGGGGGTGGGGTGGVGDGGVTGSGTGGSAPADDGSGGQAPPPVTVAPGQGAQVEPSPAPATGDFGDMGIDSTDLPLGRTGSESTDTGDMEAAGRDMAAENGGGTGTLTIVAIVLGVLLGAALIGSIAASRLAQKTH